MSDSSDTDSPPVRLTPLLQRMLGYGLLLLLSLGVALGVVLWHDHQVRYRHGQEQVRAITDGAERQLRGELGYVEHGLAGLAADARLFARTTPDQAAALVAARVAGIQQRNPDLRGIHLSTALPDLPGLRATGAGAPSSRNHLRIGSPRHVAGVGWVLPIAQPIRGAAPGEPAWVVAMLRTRALEPIAADLDLGSDGIANILHRDGTLVVRSRDQARWVGTSLRDSELVREQMPRAPVGDYELVSVLDGNRRVAAYRVLADYPLVVTAGIARRDVMQGWTRFAATASVLGGLLALLWLALLWVLLRSRWRQRQLGHSLRRSAQQLREARRIACIGDWRWDVDAGRVTWSEEIYGIYGLPAQAESFGTRDVPGRLHPGDRERVKAYMAQIRGGGDASEIEYRILRADGAVRTIYAKGEWIDRRPGQRVVRGIQQDITELAVTREQLRAAQDEYRFLFEHNPLPMFVFDRVSLAMLAANQSMLKSYGYARDELLAMSLLDIRPPEDRAAAEAAARLQSNERPQGRVWTHRRKDGSTLRVAVHTHDIEFDGLPARLVLALDVTDQERNEQRFQLIARATTDAVWDWDLQTGVTWRSDNVYPLFGYAPGEFGASLDAWSELLHPDDRERVLHSVQHGIDSGASEWEERYQLRRKDGRYAQVLDRSFILRDEHGKAIRAVGGMVDISEKHQHETDLRLLRRAVESTENGVVIADARLPDLPIVYVNAAFERITGYTAEEVLGRNCRFLQGDDRDQGGRHEIRRGIEHGREARALLRNHRKDGAVFWNDLHVNPVRDEAGVITHFVGVQNDVTERQRHQAQIVHRATHDELTGLPNRTLLLDRLQQAIAAAARFGRGVGVAFVDLDNFKLINDGLGHAAGDHALRAVAGALVSCVRDTDTVSRFGGDEFVLVIAEQADSGGVASVIQRVQASFAEPLGIGGAQHYLSSSIGYACYPEHGDDAETLLMHADIAMYEAKQAGRNRVTQYRPEFDAVASERLHLITRLRQALVRNEFVLHFQPLFRADGTATGVEALVRWQHPEQGLLPPGRFIGACESSGLIVELGRWVLQEAARHHALLAEQGLGHLTVSINVSALQFLPGLLDDVQDVIALYGLPRGALEIELTESAVMADPESAIAIMNRLNALGVTIAVDDFGTGYSSLAYLKRLPISRLKIDRSFVRDLGQDEDDEAICTSIITLARSLDLSTVAEGVETVEQHNWLLAQGCDELQGFLLAKPAPFEVIMQLLVPVPVTP